MLFSDFTKPEHHINWIAQHGHDRWAQAMERGIYLLTGNRVKSLTQLTRFKIDSLKESLEAETKGSSSRSRLASSVNQGLSLCTPIPRGKKGKIGKEV